MKTYIRSMRTKLDDNLDAVWGTAAALTLNIVFWYTLMTKLGVMSM